MFLDPVEPEVEEGGRRLRTHLERERSGRLVSWFKRRLPHARCEACGFDFERWYGELGRAFIEAHHELPLGERDEAGPTTLDDLRAVCSNCHRMLHRRFPALRVEDLRDQITELRALLGARV